MGMKLLVWVIALCAATLVLAFGAIGAGFVILVGVGMLFCTDEPGPPKTGRILVGVALGLPVVLWWLSVALGWPLFGVLAVACAISLGAGLASGFFRKAEKP